MKTEEALNIIEQACAEFIGKKIDHIKIEQALLKIREELKLPLPEELKPNK